MNTQITQYQNKADLINIDITTLTPEQISKYGKLTEKIDEANMSSISNFGSELYRTMSNVSNELLNQRFSNSNSTQSASLIADLLGELEQVDIDDLSSSGFTRFCRKVPVLRNCITSVKSIVNKYNTIQDNINNIIQKLEQVNQIAQRDNNLLQKQFDENIVYIKQLEDLIIAGKIKSSEIQQEISNSSIEDEYEYSDIVEFKNLLDKRVNDLLSLRYVFKQSLAQIRVIQRTNMVDIDNTNSQISIVVPLWKNQLSLAVALYNQQQSIDIKNRVSEATNEILTRNAEMLKGQSIEVFKQSQRSIIDLVTLQNTTRDLIDTVTTIQNEQKRAIEARNTAEQEIIRLERQLQNQLTCNKQLT